MPGYNESELVMSQVMPRCLNLPGSSWEVLRVMPAFVELA